MEDIRIGVIGLGYVGLPLVPEFAKHFPCTVGYDANAGKVERIRSGEDPTREGLEPLMKETRATFSSDPSALSVLNFLIVVVPTPVDRNNRPDLSPLVNVCNTVGKYLQKGATVVFESTVYPGVTEDICGPILEKVSGLKARTDFYLGYSPERVNPGDKERTVQKIVKVVSGQDAETLDRVANVYGKIIEAGIHRAPSIKVAEAAKVIENTQRDLNIALMNELSLIFDRMKISTHDVLEAAGTKWNFPRFSPGLVGGHCIGVDPYWLTTIAEELGYHPQVILAGRRINDGMGHHIAQRTVKLLIDGELAVKGARVGVLGLTFKENVADIRNSRVPDIIAELKEFGIDPLIHDPLAEEADAMHEYGLSLCGWKDLTDLDALILAVPHRQFLEKPLEELLSPLSDGGVLVDVKSVLHNKALPVRCSYWSL